MWPRSRTRLHRRCLVEATPLARHDGGEPIELLLVVVGEPLRHTRGGIADRFPRMAKLNEAASRRCRHDLRYVEVAAADGSGDDVQGCAASCDIVLATNHAQEAPCVVMAVRLLAQRCPSGSPSRDHMLHPWTGHEGRARTATGLLLQPLRVLEKLEMLAPSPHARIAHGAADLRHRDREGALD